jgi:hypothetical protein
MTDYRKSKWWIKLIRERNYFGFRFWWFNWLLLLTACFVFYFLWTSTLFKSEECSLVESSINVNKIIKALDKCCPCQTIIPKPDTLAVECPDRILVFQVCNSNRQRDDNFDVYLNETKIGSLDLNSDALVGSVFIASNIHDVKIKKADFSCPISNMKEYYFDPSIVKYGSNTIKMINTQKNNNGNQGTIEIRNYLLTNNELSNPCKVKNLIYQINDGANHTIKFNYTRCCE